MSGRIKGLNHPDVSKKCWGWHMKRPRITSEGRMPEIEMMGRVAATGTAKS